MKKSNLSGFVAAGIASVLGLIIGCGGGGGGGGSAPVSTPVSAPTGNLAVSSSSLAGYQSLNGGVAYPFKALVQTAPSGSGINTALALVRSLTRSAPTLISGLNLYEGDPTGSGGTIKINYYSDAAGQNPAGSMTLSTAQGTYDSSQGTFNYTKYPATIALAVNVTAGNLPCQGSGTIVYNGASGTNVMKGTLNLTRNNEQISLNLTLSPSGQVAGTMTVTEQGTTITITNPNGQLEGDLSCDFTLAPQGYSGTGTLNLTNATMALKFTNPTGVSSTTDSAGDLVITYANGTTQTIPNPLTSTLLVTGGNSGSTTTGSTGSSSTTSSTTGSSGTTAATTGTTTSGTTTSGTTGSGGTKLYYATPAALPQTSSVTIAKVTPDGQMVGNIFNSGYATPYYFPGPTATKQPLAGSISQVFGLNKSTQIVGSSNDSAVIWLTPTSNPTTLQPYQSATYPWQEAEGINSKGEIVGVCYTEDAFGNYTYIPLYWKNYQSAPVALSTAVTAGGSNQFMDGATDIDDNDHIYDRSAYGLGFYWPSVNANPVAFVGDPLGVGNFGAVGFNTPNAYVWPAPSFVAKQLTGASARAYCVNDSGLIGGMIATNTPGIWAIDGTPNALSAMIPSTPTFTGTVDHIAFLFADGSFITASDPNSEIQTYYYAKPRPAP